MALRTLLITPAGRSKIWDRDIHMDPASLVKANDAFIGRFALRSRQYAEKLYPGDWVILSPHYGFLLPEDRIKYYKGDRFFSDNAADLETIKENAEADGLLNYERVVFLGSEIDHREYIEIVKAVFKEKWIEFPILQARNREEMLGKLVDAMTRGLPLRNSTITLSKFDIKGLFGSFDHEIPLSGEERLSIITAPNGYGKTTILRLLRAVFVGNLQEIHDITFESATLTFLTHEIQDKETETNQAQVSTLILRRETQGRHGLQGGSGSGGWLLYFTYILPSGEERKYVFDPDNLTEEETSWELSRVIPPIPVKYISAQRLWQNAASDAAIEGDLLVSHRGRAERVYELTVLNFSDDISRRIQAMLADYAASAQELNLTYPRRYINNLRNYAKHPERLRRTEDIIDDLELLREEQRQLETLGFLYYKSAPVSEQIIKPEDIAEDQSARVALEVFIEDARKKFSVFDDLKQKIDLFQRICNDLFLRLMMEVRSDKGFNLIFDGKESIPPDHLSSGEQNQIVLYYDLIFQSDPGTLVLIDEPEISLHIVWQRQFITYLNDILAITGSDFVLATHSPQLIHTHWDSTIDLAGEAVCERENEDGR